MQNAYGEVIWDCKGRNHATGEQLPLDARTVVMLKSWLVIRERKGEGVEAFLWSWFLDEVSFQCVSLSKAALQRTQFSVSPSWSNPHAGQKVPSIGSFGDSGSTKTHSHGHRSQTESCIVDKPSSQAQRGSLQHHKMGIWRYRTSGLLSLLPSFPWSQIFSEAVYIE